MRTIVLLVLAAWALFAAPAMAAVVDSAQTLSPREEDALAQGLAELPGRFDVLYVDTAPGGAVRMAKAEFQARNLGPDDGVIVVAVGDREVGVSLGDAYAARGVTDSAIERHIREDFVPAARTGDYADAALALAHGFAASEPSEPEQPAAPGFPWWLVLIPVAGAAIFFLLRRHAAPSDLGPRLDALEAQQSRILNGAMKLDEAGTLGKFQSGRTAEIYASLGRRAGPMLGSASQLGALLEEARSLYEAGKTSKAEEAVVQLEASAGPLAAEVAAGLTALTEMADDPEEAKARLAEVHERVAGLAGTGVRPEVARMLQERLEAGDRLLADQDATGALATAVEVQGALDRLEGRKTASTPQLAWAELPDQAEDVARRAQELSAAYAHERDRGRTFGLAGDPRIEGRLADATRMLTTPPVNLDGARRALKEAGTALARYHDEVEAEADRRSRQTQAPLPQFGWGLGPVIFMDHDWGGPYDGGSSGGGSWGSSGGGSWGGGSSGGGNW